MNWPDFDGAFQSAGKGRINGPVTVRDGLTAIGCEELDYCACVHLEGSLLGILDRAQYGDVFGSLYVSHKTIAFLQEVIVSRRDFDDPRFNLDNGKGDSVMGGFTELIEISDCRRISDSATRAMAES